MKATGRWNSTGLFCFMLLGSAAGRQRMGNGTKASAPFDVFQIRCCPLGTRPLAAARNGGAWEYLLPDARPCPTLHRSVGGPLGVGSVRQIADANGNVTLAKSYEPREAGTVLTSTGTASSIFAYTGEQIDTTGLIYLRARYMNPRLGIFLARDPREGDMLRPGSMNGFNYGEGNPINATDPSGQIACFPPNHWVVEYDWSEGRRQLVGRRCVGPKALPPVFGGSTTTTSTGTGNPASDALKILLAYGIYCIGQLAQEIDTQTKTWTWQDIYSLPVADPFRAPLPTPVPLRDPFPLPRPQPTPTEEPQRKHIALGHNNSRDGLNRPILFYFWFNLKKVLNPQGIEVYLYGAWQDAGLSTVPSAMFSEAFDQAATKAEHIHFNLEGIDDPKEYIRRFGNQGKFEGRFEFTAAELYRIKARPDLCAKTSFYENSDLTLSSRGICGN